MQTDYKVKLEIFEGPLDLLLYLIKKNEVDIYDIPIEQITKQYLEYLDLFKILDLDVAGDFVVMAANLIYIKSRSLLPADQQMAEETAEEDDPRWELVRQLIEYKKFKDVAGHLQQREVARQDLFARIPDREDIGERPLGEISIFDLINAFQRVLRKTDRGEDLRDIFEENFTVSDKIDLIMQLIALRGSVGFSELFTETASRTEIVVTFLALLELVRLKQVRATQDDEFGEIQLSRI
jgi:segregation and condensation protein A